MLVQFTAMIEVECPYCGEPSTIEPEEGEFTMDCPVCCRPWVVTVTVDDDGPHAQVRPENE